MDILPIIQTQWVFFFIVFLPAQPHNNAILLSGKYQGRHGWQGQAPRFWVSIRSYKKQLIKNIWGRILGIAWLKFAMVPLNIKPSFIVNFLKCVKIDQGLNVTTNKKATIQNLDYFLRTDMAKEYFKNY